MGRPLDGITVVSLEQAVAAPFASCRLADLGARVLKIERPEGDFARHYDRIANGQSAYFAWLNRGKESVVLDLARTADRDRLAVLVAGADVFLQNLKPGAAAQLGFASAALRQRHPRLITCDISGYGPDGPYAARKAYDLLIQAESGLASITGAPEAPGRVGVSVVDIATGMNAAGAVLAALVERQRTGRGRAISVSLFDSMAEWMAVPLLQYDYGGGAPGRPGLAHPSIAPYGLYPCADGQILLAVQNEREWQLLCERVLEQPALAEEERFRDNPARVANRAALERAIAAVLSRLPLAEATGRLDAAGIAWGALNGVEVLSRHPQLRRITVFSETGPITMPAPAARFDGDDGMDYGTIPALERPAGET